MKNKVRGFGVNDAEYTVQVKRKIEGKVVQIWICPYYRKWMDMLNRANSVKYQNAQPTYEGTSVAEEWTLFSNFKSWMETKVWEGLDLDKDILVEGNKVYSPDTCVFVPKYLNNLFLSVNSKRGDYPLGVYREKETSKFRASVRTRDGRQKTLGRFLSAAEAHKAWQLAKIAEINETLNKYKLEPYFDQKVFDAIKNKSGKILQDSCLGVETK